MDSSDQLEKIRQVPKTNPPYSDEFRRDAVELLITSGRPLKVVADELGVASNTLRAWRNKAWGAGSAGGSRDGRKPGESAPGADGPQGLAEIRSLRHENEYLRRQRDILKKAVSILGEDPQLGMR